MKSNTMLSAMPEQHAPRARRGRSRIARPPLPILPPFPGSQDEKTHVSPKNTKNLKWQEYVFAPNEERVEDESRHDEASARMPDDEVIRSTITSWKEPNSRLPAKSSLASDNRAPDTDITPFDEQPFFDRKRQVHRGESEISNNDRLTRDLYQLNRLQAKAQRRKMHDLGNVEEKALNFKHLRASRIKVVRDLYKCNKQDSEAHEGIGMAESADVSSVRDLTTLSSYRGKCFDKMVYLLNDVAPLEETVVPYSVNEEGTSLSSHVGEKVAELKLIKKVVQPKQQQGGDVGTQSVPFPEEIDQPDTDTIASKLSDVTSPTIQDGFELDEVPHFPFLAAARKNNLNSAVSNIQGDHLPSLAEVNESSEELHVFAGGSKSADNFNIREASRIWGSTSSSVLRTVDAGKAKKATRSLIEDNDEEEDSKNEQDSMIEEINAILCEREAEMEAKARKEQFTTAVKNQEDEASKQQVMKRVRFFEPSKTEAVPQTHCCIIM